MLATLEKGVKGGCWYSLMDKVYRPRTLYRAYARVARNKGAAGVDHVTVKEFTRNLSRNLEDLTDSLREGSYRPQAVRRVWIPKPGRRERRPLGIPTVRDRVVQTALRIVLEPIFEQGFAEQSYGFRPGRGCKDALRRVDELLKAGYRYAVDADLKSYFDTIPHERLLARVREKVSDGAVLRLVASFLRQGVLDGMSGWTPEEGTPQGAVISPLLSNIYLDPLDHLAARQGHQMVRYADDFVILCRTRQDAERALAMVQKWTAEAGLRLHPEKTRIADAEEEGFEFLGYLFRGGRRLVRPKSLKHIRAVMRAKTRRNAGRSLHSVITDLNRILRGWFVYYQHAPAPTYRVLDAWIRGRLRSILRRRRGGRGRGRGADHQRWPNAFFTAQGLLSLTAAHALARQSARR
ncbi:MAG: group II intron reverse transcriptase/maturase [Bacteroidetes bacterium]|nr:MAG: group II intron reverse transcriptase/maturase [Bacteroidota bacterium]